MHFHGKQAIQDRHDQIHRTFLKNSTFNITHLELREVNPNLILAFVRWEVRGVHKPDSFEGRQTIQGIFSHVFINKNGVWEITATQNTVSKE